MALPKQVLIIRHGEKYGVPDPAPDAFADTPENSDPDENGDAADPARGASQGGASQGDASGAKHLSIRGSARAMALPSLFAKSGLQFGCNLERLGYDGVKGSYMQARESGILPRFSRPDIIFATKESQASNRPCETVAPLSAYLGLPVDHSFSNAQFADLANKVKEKCGEKIVLICWHHGKIPKLARAFGIMNPPKWPGSVFDRVWQITWTSVPGGLLLEDLPQRLLFGDSLI